MNLLNTEYIGGIWDDPEVQTANNERYIDQKPRNHLERACVAFYEN